MSQHPADRLIRELIGARRNATPEEVAQILSRMGETEFPIAARHLGKRKREGQWRENVCLRDYVEDFRRAVGLANAHLSVYERRRGAMAALLANTADVVPAERLGDGARPLFFVFYSADRSIIASVYQASTMDDVALPKDTRWLK